MLYVYVTDSRCRSHSTYDSFGPHHYYEIWARFRTVRKHIALDNSIDPSNFIPGLFRPHILAAIVYVVAPMCGLENAASVLHELEIFEQ
jgi:hypothetical protein